MTKQTKEWHELIESLKSLFTKQSIYYKIDKEERQLDFSNALNDHGQKVYALHLMINEESYIKEFCFQNLVDISIHGGAGYLGLARNIIIDMEKEFVEKSLDSAIENSLKISVNTSELDYVLRNIAELLLSLGFYHKLRLFIELHCKNSENEDIKDIFSHYFRKIN